EALEVLDRLDPSGVNEIFAHDEGGEVVAGPRLSLVRHDLEVHAARDGVVEAGRRGTDGHVQLTGSEGGNHLGPGGEGLELQRDAAGLAVSPVEGGVEAHVGDRGQLAHLHHVGSAGDDGTGEGEGKGDQSYPSWRARGHGCLSIRGEGVSRKGSPGGRTDSSARRRGGIRAWA